MKYILLIFTYVLVHGYVVGQCTFSKKDAEKLLNPYIYDNHVPVKINTYARPYEETVTFNVYKSPAYKFAFNFNCDMNDVKVAIYALDKKGRETLVFESNSKDKNVYEVVDPSKQYMVVVSVEEGALKGCVDIALGFKVQSESLGGKRKKKQPKLVFK